MRSRAPKSPTMPRTIIIDQSHTRSQPTARLATRASSYGLASRGGHSVPRGLGHVTISTPIAQQDQLDTLLQALVTVLGSDGAQLYEDSEGYHIDAATCEFNF